VNGVVSERLVIGIDVGSGSSKAVVFDLAGRLRSVGKQFYEPNTPAPGVAEYDARSLQCAAVSALAEAVRGVNASSVEAIAVDAMISGMAPLGAGGEPIAPYTTTLDTRSSRYLTRVLSRNGDLLRRLTGSSQPTLGPKITWFQDEFPDVAARTAKYVVAGNLVAGYLAGLDAGEAFVDPTYFWSTGLADTAGLGVAVSALPRIVRPTDVIGRLSATRAAEVGLREGIPVVAGCGDQAAGYLGAGVSTLGKAADSAGTYSVFAGVTGKFAMSEDSDAPDVVPLPVGPNFNVQAMVIGGGMTRHWARELFGPSDKADDEGLELAEESDLGARGVRFVPHLGGQAYPAHPDLRGAWLGLTWAHRPADLYRAVLEGIALDNVRSAMRMEAQYQDVNFDSVTVYGGGSRSSLWNQVKADALGVRYESLGDAPVTALGVAMLAAQGVGLVDDAAAAAAQAIQPERTYEPDPRRHEQYVELLSEYLTAVSLVRQLPSG
jgi:xylulokinase